MELREQLLTASLFVSIVIPLYYLVVAWIQAQVANIVVLGSTQPVSNDASLSLPDLLTPSDEIHHKVHMDLLADGRWESLVNYFFLLRLFSETNGVNDALHLGQLLRSHEQFLTGYILIVGLSSILSEVISIIMRILSTELVD